MLNSILETGAWVALWILIIGVPLVFVAWVGKRAIGMFRGDR